MVRGSQGVEAGNWYYEVEVLDPPSVEEVVKALPNNVQVPFALDANFDSDCIYSRCF